ncbi:MAG: hypothetical protein NTZ52_07810 [Chlamydiae bacterium]|nr:hypothetical protein [Chlamydiota bacterium]
MNDPLKPKLVLGTPSASHQSTAGPTKNLLTTEKVDKLIRGNGYLILKEGKLDLTNNLFEAKNTYGSLKEHLTTLGERVGKTALFSVRVEIKR